MNAEFFAALDDIERDKGISKAYMLEKITLALTAALKKDHPTAAENIFVRVDENAKKIDLYVRKTVVEEVEDPDTQMTLEEAKKIQKKAVLEEEIDVPVETKKFGRIAAQAAKQVIIQGIREAERGMVFDEFTSKEHEILTGQVTRVDPRSGSVSVRIGSGSENTEGMLSPHEQVRGEVLREGERVKVYVVEVRRSTRGPQVLISRTHPGLVRRLFELEVPEIGEGLVEVMSIAREAGSRTKMAVWSNEGDVDPVGACVGPRGGRVAAIVDELGGEKIDIIPYSEDPAAYIAAALAPAQVVEVNLAAGDEKVCRVVVPDDQLSLAIGKEGQNARLAARLTGYKIDIGPVSAAGGGN
ncbi:MAG: transcription termination factor NusA [Oscillospiraceae bacterium]|nr:transcription termination factor NusA [Oscillospiraceae bacterium]